MCLSFNTQYSMLISCRADERRPHKAYYHSLGGVRVRIMEMHGVVVVVGFSDWQQIITDQSSSFPSSLLSTVLILSLAVSRSLRDVPARQPTSTTACV